MFPYNDAVRKLLDLFMHGLTIKKIKRVIFIDDDNYLDQLKAPKRSKILDL